MPGDNALPFFAAEYEGRRVSIRRTANYEDVINCVRQAFPSLSDIRANQVTIVQVFPELGEGAVEITRDMWKDVLSLIKTTQVVVSKAKIGPAGSKKRKAVSYLDPGSDSDLYPEVVKPTTGGSSSKNRTGAQVTMLEPQVIRRASRKPTSGGSDQNSPDEPGLHPSTEYFAYLRTELSDTTVPDLNANFLRAAIRRANDALQRSRPAHLSDIWASRELMAAPGPCLEKTESRTNR